MIAPIKHRSLKNGAVSVSDIFWILVSLGDCCFRIQGVSKIFQKKKKKISFIFSFGYITKIDKSNESDGNTNFMCNYMDVHFFYLFFWTLVCNLKTI